MLTGKEIKKACQEFNYLAFNAAQAELADQAERNREAINKKAARQKLQRQRRARVLKRELDKLMAEWLYRDAPRYNTTEELVDRISEVETELFRLL